MGVGNDAPVDTVIKISLIVVVTITGIHTRVSSLVIEVGITAIALAVIGLAFLYTPVEILIFQRGAVQTYSVTGIAAFAGIEAVTCPAIAKPAV
ncbi:Uncharacterised protein [Salmonella enterica subsp. arizonae]|uniref:Uncharacterized protein n=1 Tax=Salmonella enterica subsp. arizonae TaxID=59203 RepID=A0A379SL76_SALER|nr:Uncharacterised protein [Salmonella enterica subsp. arizonae]